MAEQFKSSDLKKSMTTSKSIPTYPQAITDDQSSKNKAMSAIFSDMKHVEQPSGGIQTYPSSILYSAKSVRFNPTTDLEVTGEVSLKTRTSPTNVSVSNGIPEKMTGVLELNEFPRGGPLYYSLPNPSGISYEDLGNTAANMARDSARRALNASLLVDGGIEITPWMHTTAALLSDRFKAIRGQSHKTLSGNTIKVDWVYARERDDHITSDSAYNPIVYTKENPYPLEHVSGTRQPIGEWNLPYHNSYMLHQFRGSVTFMNPENDPDKQTIMDLGMEAYDSTAHTDHIRADYDMRVALDSKRDVAGDEIRSSPATPVSPLIPFTRMYADRAHNAIVSAYNRTKIPIADIEHRKAFRHIFITRPECYLMANGDVPSIQVLNDDDMATCWQRFPHVLRALSPVYVSPSNGNPKYANWNWLLSNRVQGLTTGSHTLNLVDSTVKTPRGNTVIMGKFIGTNSGSSLELQFNDTKYMDVYEMLRIWMLYIHKRRMGSFFPAFNGYQQTNGFYPNGVSVKQPGGYSTLHPYDRALDYCASIYDIVTDETGSKILYWCKYYGVYPVNISNSMLSNTNNAPLTSEAKISATFQYQYKQENIFKNLVEFNFNAGIVDGVGNMRSDVEMYLRNSVPFLYRENGEGGTSYTSDALPNYIGASSMFTGSPYIITQYSGSVDPWTMSVDSKLVRAELCFVPLFYGQDKLNAAMNLGITNERVPDRETREFSVLTSGR